MGAAIGDSLPLALGVAFSPMSIVAVILMLVSRKGKVNGPLFVLGWLGFRLSLLMAYYEWIMYRKLHAMGKESACEGGFTR